MKIGLQDLLPKYAKTSSSVAAFNVFSIEWAKAVIRAAERANAPVIIMTNKSMIEHIRPKHCGPIFSNLAEIASVPVCVHLDHNTDFDTIQEAIDYGFSSVMFDGSSYRLEDNIAYTSKACTLARKSKVSIEGEVGRVAYTDIPDSTTTYTSPEEAERFVASTQVDALAISVGSTHRMIHKGVHIQYARIEEIQKRVSVPLVIHGTSGIEDKDIIKMKQYRIAKFNIGTILRKRFSERLRSTLKNDKEIFDLYDITKPAYTSIEEESLKIIQLMENKT